MRVQCNHQTKVVSHKILIINDKTDYYEIVPVLHIMHYGVFDTDTVADYELKM